MNNQELLHSPLIPPPMIRLAQKAARNNVPVFIRGERGTGKEMVAKGIHHLGDWKYYRFYKVDCRTLAEGGLVDQLTRLFKETNFGAVPATLYLKEVGQLSQSDQSRLLEMMEDGIFQMGESKKVSKNLRVISSSSENMKDKMMQGKFSEDLYHRLDTFPIHLPPLRERPEEISAVAQYILDKHSKTIKINKVGISKNVMNLLKSYWWPGNLKELEQVIIRSAIFSEGGNLMEKDLLFETENESHAFTTFLKKTERRSSGFNPSGLPRDPSANSLSLFLVELAHRIKNPLVSIKTFNQLLRDRFTDQEFREQFYRIVTEDIEKIDGVLNGLLSYVKINNPLEKKDTIHFILEDVLKEHEGTLEDKRIKVFKNFEKGLPETIVHDEQLKYILNALIQYALPSIPPHGSLGILTKSSGTAKESANDQEFFEQGGRTIEILIVFTGYKRPIEKFESVLGISNVPKEESIELELRLIKEIIQKNRGRMRFQINEKKPRTIISLKFPTERRKLIYYEPMKT